MSARTESWERDGRTVTVPIRNDDTIIVAYDLMAQMLADLGFVQQDVPR